MDLTHLDLNLFVVFDTIYREASLTRAGRQMLPALDVQRPTSRHTGRLPVMTAPMVVLANQWLRRCLLGESGA